MGSARKAPKLPAVRGAMDGILRKIGATRNTAQAGTLKESKQVNYVVVQAKEKFEFQRQRILQEAYMKSLIRRA